MAEKCIDIGSINLIIFAMIMILYFLTLFTVCYKYGNNESAKQLTNHCYVFTVQIGGKEETQQWGGIYLPLDLRFCISTSAVFKNPDILDLVLPEEE